MLRAEARLRSRAPPPSAHLAIATSPLVLPAPQALLGSRRRPCPSTRSGAAGSTNTPRAESRLRSNRSLHARPAVAGSTVSLRRSSSQVRGVCATWKHGATMRAQRLASPGPPSPPQPHQFLHRRFDTVSRQDHHPSSVPQQERRWASASRSSTSRSEFNFFSLISALSWPSSTRSVRHPRPAPAPALPLSAWIPLTRFAHRASFLLTIPPCLFRGATPSPRDGRR